jgi:hypothetical protein
MEATDRVLGAEKLTSVFGYWPSFHDAEVVRLELDRRASNEGHGPTLNMLVHAFEITNEVGPDGCYVLKHHVLVHFRFHDVVELQLEGFNHQNVLFGMAITDLSERQGEHIHYQVRLEAAFGMDASFQCHQVEVVSVTACDNAGVEISAFKL